MQRFIESYILNKAALIEIESLELKQVLPSGSKLLSVRPSIDSSRILRVGRRQQSASLTCIQSYCKGHGYSRLD